MRRISQRSPEWSGVHLNGTGSSIKKTIGTIGCLICSICMIHSKFYPRNWLRPDTAAKTWSFTVDGLLKWLDTSFDGMAFVHRHYEYDKKFVKDYVKTPGLGVVVQVDGYHWLAIWGWSIWGQPVCFDPIDGHILWFPLRRYKKFTGYALFREQEF
jgi:hypothetical protein